jgi:hypothetical protein
MKKLLRSTALLACLGIFGCDSEVKQLSNDLELPVIGEGLDWCAKIGLDYLSYDFHSLSDEQRSYVRSGLKARFKKIVVKI